jgi:hypothetical protein
MTSHSIRVGLEFRGSRGKVLPATGDFTVLGDMAIYQESADTKRLKFSVFRRLPRSDFPSEYRAVTLLTRRSDGRYCTCVCEGQTVYSVSGRAVVRER